MAPGNVLDRLKRRRDSLAAQGLQLERIVDELARQVPKSTPLARWRVVLGLSQEGLVDQTWRLGQPVSLRTVQRVEAGADCKLHTLQALGAAIQATARQAGTPVTATARRLGPWQLLDQPHPDTPAATNAGGPPGGDAAGSSPRHHPAGTAGVVLAGGVVVILPAERWHIHPAGGQWPA
jgi:hypothetical protein